MNPIKAIVLLAIVAFCNSSCKEQKEKTDTAEAIATSEKISQNNLERLKSNLHFIADSLLKGKSSLVENYLSKYLKDSCGALTYTTESLRSNFEGTVDLGDINTDQKRDTVCVIPPLNFCEEGDSYVFYDTSLPRLSTESVCCHPSNIFSAGDIDEDGISEIGLYFSSCTSHYKRIIVYSLKNKEWKEIGDCIYDLNYADQTKPYSSFVRKTGKNKFEMFEITDLTEDTNMIGKPNWIKFSMNH